MTWHESNKHRTEYFASKVHHGMANACKHYYSHPMRIEKSDRIFEYAANGTFAELRCMIEMHGCVLQSVSDAIHKIASFEFVCTFHYHIHSYVWTANLDFVVVVIAIFLLFHGHFRWLWRVLRHGTLACAECGANLFHFVNETLLFCANT